MIEKWNQLLLDTVKKRKQGRCLFPMDFRTKNCLNVAYQLHKNSRGNIEIVELIPSDNKVMFKTFDPMIIWLTLAHLETIKHLQINRVSYRKKDDLWQVVVYDREKGC